MCELFSKALAQFPTLKKSAITDQHLSQAADDIDEARKFATSKSDKFFYQPFFQDVSNVDTPFQFNVNFVYISLFLSDNVQSSSSTQLQDKCSRSIQIRQLMKKEQIEGLSSLKWRISMGHRWPLDSCDQYGQEDAEWSCRGPNSRKGA